MTYIISSKNVSISRGKPKFAVNVGIKPDKFKTGWVINSYSQLYNVIGKFHLDMFYVDLDDAVIVNGVILSNMIFVELYGKPILTSDNSKKFPSTNVKPLVEYDNIKVGDIFKREDTTDVYTILSKDSFSFSSYHSLPLYSVLNQIDGIVRFDGTYYNGSAFQTITLLDRIKEFPVIRVRNRELTVLDENLITDYVEESNMNTTVHKSKTLEDHAEFLKTFDKSDFTNFDNSDIDINIMYGKIDKKKVDIVYPLFLRTPRLTTGTVYFDGTNIKYDTIYRSSSFDNTIEDYTKTIQGTKSELKNYLFNSLVRDSIVDASDQVHSNFDPYEYCLVHRNDKIAVIHKSEFNKIKSIEMEVSEVVTNGGKRIKCFTDVHKKRIKNGL